MVSFLCFSFTIVSVFLFPTLKTIGSCFFRVFWGGDIFSKVCFIAGGVRACVWSSSSEQAASEKLSRDKSRKTWPSSRLPATSSSPVCPRVLPVCQHRPRAVSTLYSHSRDQPNNVTLLLSERIFSQRISTKRLIISTTTNHSLSPKPFPISNSLLLCTKILQHASCIYKEYSKQRGYTSDR